MSLAPVSGTSGRSYRTVVYGGPSQSKANGIRPGANPKGSCAVLYISTIYRKYQIYRQYFEGADIFLGKYCDTSDTMNMSQHIH
jgi:hypothetical protein